MQSVVCARAGRFQEQVYYRKKCFKDMTMRCELHMILFSAQKSTHYLLLFDGFVIVVCMISAVLCTRSIILAVRLLQVNLHERETTHIICLTLHKHSCDISSLRSDFLDSVLKIITARCVKTTKGNF